MHRFDDRVRTVLRLAQQEALLLQQHQIAPVHLMLGLLREDEMGTQFLVQLGLHFAAAKRLLPAPQDATIADSTDSAQQPDLQETTRAILEVAASEARRLQSEQVSTGHIVLALAKRAEQEALTDTPSLLAQIFVQAEVSTRAIMRRVLESLQAKTKHSATVVTVSLQIPADQFDVFSSKAREQNLATPDFLLKILQEHLENELYGKV